MSSYKTALAGSSYSKFKVAGNTIYQVWCAQGMSGQCGVFKIDKTTGDEISKNMYRFSDAED